LDNFQAYWQYNTFEAFNRISNIKAALKTRTPKNTSFIRLGSEYDGGYVLADDVTKDDFLVSFGVEGNVDFEKAISEYGCRINMYDYSVDGPPQEIPNSIFFKDKIGLESDGDTSLGYCLGKTAQDVLLKVDIEGSEWKVLAMATAAELNRARQITVEFHWLQNLENDLFSNLAQKAFDNLRKTHTPVLVHANNDVPIMVMGNSVLPMVIEVLYLRNSSYEFEEDKDLFKGLVNRNNPNFPEIGLTFP